MSLIDQLRTNKGTVSSRLGKDLAQKVLEGRADILSAAAELAVYDLRNAKEKNIRSGAAKIVQCVAAEKPELVAPYLEALLPALEAAEPQTRWMIIRTMGCCARLRPKIAARAIPFARKYIREKTAGQLCLVSSADVFLGDYGEISAEHATMAIPILLESAANVITNEPDWIMEAFVKVSRYLAGRDKQAISLFAKRFVGHARKASRERAKALLEACQFGS